MTSYEICKVPNYKTIYKNSEKTITNANVLCEILKKDFQFHERLCNTDILKLSVDIDKLRKYKPNHTFDMIINDITDYVKVDINDISYTTNFSVKEGSHHIVIPKYSMISSLQKEFWKSFREKYNYGKEIDADIFNKNTWFRLPNQTKEGLLGTEHIIQKGIMQDFLLKCIENTLHYPFELKPVITKKIKIKNATKTDYVEKDDKDLKILIDCLKTERANNYDDWYKIGMILKNENADVSLFHYFSKKSDKYNEIETNNKWESFKGDGLSVSSLHYYAKYDNLELYAEKFLNIYKVNLYDPMFTSGLIAEYFKKLFSDKFVYCDGILYYFNGIYWKCDDKNNSFLNLFISNELHKNLVTYAYTNLKLNTENKTIDEEMRTIINNKLIQLQTNICSLKKIGVRKAFIEDIIIHITNNEIKFDEKPLLFAFENKIYDLVKGDFTEPNPKDYISLSCGYEYKDINDFDDKKKDLLEIINKILPEPEIRDFYLTILSTGLSGIQLQNFFISTGIGGNGKSVVDTLMLKTTGNYGYKIPNTVLLNPIKEGPNPQVFCINKKRFILATEPSDKYKVCCSTIKELTGDKTLNVRDNYSSKCGINLSLTLLMECNNLPLLDESTEAMLRRVIAIEFKSRFLSSERYELEKDEPNTYKGDPYFSGDDFINEYKQVFFMILSDYFKIFKDNKFTLPSTPEDCKNKTMEYMSVSDNIYDWFDNICEKEEDGMMTFKEIFETFKEGEFYNNMSKQDKRNYNQKYFYDKLEKNVFLRKFIKRRDEYFNKKMLKCDCIVGWRYRVN